MTTPSPIRYIGVLVSPHPRSSAWKMKKPNMNATPRKMVRVYSTANWWTSVPGVVPMSGSSIGVSR